MLVLNLGIMVKMIMLKWAQLHLPPAKLHRPPAKLRRRHSFMRLLILLVLVLERVLFISESALAFQNEPLPRN